MGVADRKEPRFPVELPVLIKLGGRAAERVTRDASFSGIYVVLEPAPEGAERLPEVSLRQLVGLTILLPPHAKRIDVAATVAHRRRDAKHHGVGLRFYGMAGDDLQAWEQYVRRLRDELPAISGRATAVLHGEHVDPVVRRREAQRCALRVAPHTVAELERLLTLDRPDACIFVESDEQVQLGDELALWLVHPDSGELFELATRVERVIDERGLRGLGLVLLDLDGERRERLREFIDDGLETLFDDDDLFDEELSSPPPATVRLTDPLGFVAAQEAALLAEGDGDPER